jgi:hypothetical protein
MAGRSAAALVIPISKASCPEMEVAGAELPPAGSLAKRKDGKRNGHYCEHRNYVVRLFDKSSLAIIGNATPM